MTRATRAVSWNSGNRPAARGEGEIDSIRRICFDIVIGWPGISSMERRTVAQEPLGAMHGARLPLLRRLGLFWTQPCVFYKASIQAAERVGFVRVNDRVWKK